MNLTFFFKLTWEIKIVLKPNYKFELFEENFLRMSIFQRLFGKPNGKETPSAQEAIQKLLQIEELMIKRQNVLEKKVDEEIKIAKQNGTKNKRGSLIFNF